LEKTYRIVARGLKHGYSRDRAADLLAVLLKGSADQMKPLLNGRSAVVKSRLSFAGATKYQAALDRCGCVSEIEIEAAGAPVLKVSAAHSAARQGRTAAPALLQIEPTADGEPLNIVIPHSICCNCGTDKEIHSITTAMSKERFNGSVLTVTAELPFCVPCVLTSDRIRPSITRQSLVFSAALAIYGAAVLRPMRDSHLFGPYTLYLLLLVFGALSGAVIYLVNKTTLPQTCHYQPVSLKTLKSSEDGVLKIGFKFSNPAYAKEFFKANKREMKKGRVV
jgi:hypothetical protein